MNCAYMAYLCVVLAANLYVFVDRVVGRYYALTLFSGSSDPACGFALLHS